MFDQQSRWFISGGEGTLIHFPNSKNEWDKVDLITNEDLNSGALTGGGNVVFTGSLGSVITFDNQSNRWLETRPLRNTALNRAVFFGATGLITGSNGNLLRSTDDGINWQIQKLSPVEDLKTAHFLNANTIIVIGHSGKVWQSSDSGDSWSLVIDAAAELNIPVVFDDFVFISGEDGRLIISDSEGTVWSAIELNTKEDLNPPVFSEKGFGFITGDNGTLLRALPDKYTDWIADPTIELPVDLNPPVFEKNIGIISGDEGALLISDNGGESWKQQHIQIPNDLTLPIFGPDRTIFLVGDDGVMLTSRNDGASWLPQKTGISSDLLTPVFDSNGKGFIASYGALYSLSDIEDLQREDSLTELTAILEGSPLHKDGGLIEQLEDQKLQLEELKSTLVEMSKVEVDDRLEKNLIRGSALAVIMFLVQVLVSNYRYSTKLASFYLSRALALEVFSELGTEKLTADDLNTIMAMLTPAADYSKAPPDGGMGSAMSIIDKLRK